MVFQQVDKDKSGQVDLLELKRFFRGSLDAQKLDSLFAALDTDDSGEITLEEWRKGYYNAGFGESATVGLTASGLGVLLGLVTRTDVLRQHKLYGEVGMGPRRVR